MSHFRRGAFLNRDLVARAQRSRLREILAPAAAMAVAIVVGGIVIALMGRSPLTAFDVYFVQPLTQSYSLQAIAAIAFSRLSRISSSLTASTEPPVERARSSA